MITGRWPRKCAISSFWPDIPSLSPPPPPAVLRAHTPFSDPCSADSVQRAPLATQPSARHSTAARAAGAAAPLRAVGPTHRRSSVCRALACWAIAGATASNPAGPSLLFLPIRARRRRRDSDGHQIPPPHYPPQFRDGYVRKSAIFEQGLSVSLHVQLVQVHCTCGFALRDYPEMQRRSGISARLLKRQPNRRTD